MSRMNLEDSKLYDPILVKGVKGDVHSETKAAAWTLDRDAAFLQFYTLTGSTRIMTLPAVERGLMFYVFNTSASALDITVNNAAASTVGTISQNEGALIVSDGVIWIVSMVGTST